MVEPVKHITEGFDALITQFKGDPRLGAVLYSYLKQVQDVEDVMIDLRKQQDLTEADLSGLDAIGVYLGEERGGLEDDEYRSILIWRVLCNASDGSVKYFEESIGILSNDSPVAFIPYWNKLQQGEYQGPLFFYPNTNYIYYRLCRSLNEASQAGFRWTVKTPDPSGQIWFYFSSFPEYGDASEVVASTPSAYVGAYA